MQVVLHRSGTDEQLRTDLRVGEAPSRAAAPATGVTLWATMYPAGDQDWFSFPNMPLSRIALSQDYGGQDGTAFVRADVFKDGELFQELVLGGTPETGFTQYVNSDTASYDWTVRVTSAKPNTYFLGFFR